MTLTLGIDIGTSGVRTAVLDGHDPISMARASHPEQDSDNIDANGWWQAVEQCLHDKMTHLVSTSNESEESSTESNEHNNHKDEKFHTLFSFED